MDEKQLITVLLISVWAFFIFLNITWTKALEEKRGWFKSGNDFEIEMALSIVSIIFAPLVFVVLLLITYLPPLSDKLKVKIKEII